MADYVATVGDGAVSGDTVTRLWMCQKDKADGIFASYKHNTEYRDGYFNKYASSIAYSEGYATLTMVFQDTPAEEEHFDGQIEHSCNASTFEKPLENKENYRVIWNHDLWVKNGTPTITGWDPATAITTLIPAELQNSVKWGDSDAPPDGWHISVARTKPGVEAYNYPAPVVTETSYYKKRSDASAKLRHIGRLSAPSYCFGYNKSAEYWLINNSSMAHDGRFWVVTTEHIYADTGWDEEIYSR